MTFVYGPKKYEQYSLNFIRDLKTMSKGEF